MGLMTKSERFSLHALSRIARQAKAVGMDFSFSPGNSSAGWSPKLLLENIDEVAFGEYGTLNLCVVRGHSSTLCTATALTWPVF